MSARITINGTNTEVTDGMVLPLHTIVRIDSIAEAYGTCTSTCPPPDGTISHRVPNHTQVGVDISSGTSVFGGIVGIV